MDISELLWEAMSREIGERVDDLFPESDDMETAPSTSAPQKLAAYTLQQVMKNNSAEFRKIRDLAAHSAACNSRASLYRPSHGPVAGAIISRTSFC